MTTAAPAMATWSSTCGRLAADRQRASRSARGWRRCRSGICGTLLPGVVEELIAGARFASPSVQLDISPSGEVAVLSTHEQLLGGEAGQVYVGCRFPAD